MGNKTMDDIEKELTQKGSTDSARLHGQILIKINETLERIETLQLTTNDLLREIRDKK